MFHVFYRNTFFSFLTIQTEMNWAELAYRLLQVRVGMDVLKYVKNVRAKFGDLKLFFYCLFLGRAKACAVRSPF